MARRSTALHRGGGDLAGAVAFRRERIDSDQRGMARARVESARAVPPPHREPAQWRARPLSHESGLRIGAHSWPRGARLCTEGARLLAGAVASRRTPTDSKQRGAARAHVASARATPPPQREPAQWRTSALHAQATPRNAGQDLHVGAQPCNEEGWLLARAVPFDSAWSDCHQRGGARARNKRACCASSPERASVVARKRTTRASHLTKRGPGLARGSTALHRKGRLLARAVALRSVWNKCRQSGAARKHSKRACCASSPERASTVARKRATRASHLVK